MRVPSPDIDARADLAACRATLRHGSRTFLAASMLLPPKVSDAACSLYAFCREADDEIDLGDDPAAGHASLTERLGRIYDGRPGRSPVDRMLMLVVRQYGIPRDLLLALLEGFAWDASGRQYDSESDLLAYASRVAGSVGVMMALLMGRQAPPILARAADLGIAMQLTNVARDVGEDARAGRLYLPRLWLREVGVDPDAWLENPVFDEAIGSVVSRVLQTADVLYHQADAGIVRLPLRCRPGVKAARTLYAAIGDEIRHRGLDSVSGRAFVPLSRKLVLLGRSMIDHFLPVHSADAPPLAEARHLIDAVVAVPTPTMEQGMGSRLIWLIDLFDRLERRQQHRSGWARPPHSVSA